MWFANDLTQYVISILCQLLAKEFEVDSTFVDTREDWACIKCTRSMHSPSQYTWNEDYFDLILNIKKKSFTIFLLYNYIFDYVDVVLSRTCNQYGRLSCLLFSIRCYKKTVFVERLNPKYIVYIHAADRFDK